jgi:hypothetical protein
MKNEFIYWMKRHLPTLEWLADQEGYVTKEDIFMATKTSEVALWELVQEGIVKETKKGFKLNYANELANSFKILNDVFLERQAKLLKSLKK